ncbi:ClpXP protease specificity-enhancing factor [Vibrio rhizosphaerae]|uniref:ClpXP protease specificity-enhancing factor n=2 Tax=Vibrio rhizosphaerae TaxID=398736 RepID=A0ABU4IWJ6_9VIBR|nr:ClpXP protease specificity-enhancing factor [Vibrio rhizosphaerae]MDW6093776.1 ClpXP protease specificity-enhancing factor [Vibrio rhizosphaerae]
MDNMTPRRPYMLRAFYDWLLENDLTPHLVVDATLPGVRVPVEFIQDGQIILNIAPRAVGNLELGNDVLTFNARFGGRPHSVIVPIFAVQAIYARENGAGTMFEPEDSYIQQLEQAQDQEEEELQNIEVVETTVADDSVSSDEPSRPRGKPSLRVIK